MTHARPFDLVIFDLDGTLVDSLPDIARALNVALAEASLPALPFETVRGFVGDGAAKLIERAVPPSAGHLGLQAALLARFVTAYTDAVCVESRLYPGVADLLDALNEAGVVTAVVTNKPGALARALLRALAIADHFTAIIGDGDGFPRKPDPAAVCSILEGSGVRTERAAIVGDGLPDLRTARAVPCSAIAAGWGYVPVPLLDAEHPTFTAPAVQDAAHILLPAWSFGR
jgi:phosphoglycolate phosphatase